MTVPAQGERLSRLYIYVLAFYCIGFLVVFGFTSAVEWKWVSRADLEPAYGWPAAFVSQQYQERGAAYLCGLSLGQDCAPVATPANLTGLSCWGAAGMSWCVDTAFTTATLIWLLICTVIYAVTCAVLPYQRLGPRPEGSRAKRQDALLQLGLNVLCAGWMIWDAYAAFKVTKPAGAAACTPGQADCVFDLSDTAPGGVATALAALIFGGAIVQVLYRHRRDLMVRAEPSLEVGK